MARLERRIILFCIRKSINRAALTNLQKEIHNQKRSTIQVVTNSSYIQERFLDKILLMGIRRNLLNQEEDLDFRESLWIIESRERRIKSK